MAEQLLDQVRDFVDGQIDFEGQKLAENLANIALTIVGAIAFLVGYFLQDIKLAVWVGLGGTALTFLVIVPAWPFFNKNPVKWLPVGGGNGSSQQAAPQFTNLVLDEKALR